MCHFSSNGHTFWEQNSLSSRFVDGWKYLLFWRQPVVFYLIACKSGVFVPIARLASGEQIFVILVDVEIPEHLLQLSVELVAPHAVAVALFLNHSLQLARVAPPGQNHPLVLDCHFGTVFKVFVALQGHSVDSAKAKLLAKPLKHRVTDHPQLRRWNGRGVQRSRRKEHGRELGFLFGFGFLICFVL